VNKNDKNRKFMNSQLSPPNSWSLEPKPNIRQQQLRIFDAFTKRALAIVEDHKSQSGGLADASRLVETALKAIEQQSANQQSATAENADRKFADDIARVYAQAKNQTTEEVA
jgi:hypothetical protein